MKLSDLKPKDDIVINDGYNHLSGDVVKKINTKWIETIQGVKFNLRNGEQWGRGRDSWSSHICHIETTRKGNSFMSYELMEWNEAREIIEKQKEESARIVLAVKLRDLKWKSLPMNILQQVNAIIEIHEAK